jgi:hypothetical protein
VQLVGAISRILPGITLSESSFCEVEQIRLGA